MPQLPKIGPLPEFRGLSAWINSEPLTVAGLHGRAVLVAFWTFGCVNCVHTLPYVNAWYEKFGGEDFEIIGVHTPEFDHERVAANVAQAVERYNIAYPVALDNDYTTWNAFGNRYWPTHYFADRDGIVRHTHIGEGDYEASEKVIAELIA